MSNLSARTSFIQDGDDVYFVLDQHA